MFSQQLLSSITAISLLLASCGGISQSKEEVRQDDETTNLTVSAASSLTDAMNEIEKLYQQQKPEVDLTYNFASSGSLEQQIQQGAPVDVFFSAASKQMNALQDKQLLLEGTRQDLLQNEVVLITPTENSSIDSFADLTNAENISIGEPEGVPAGKYAKEALTSLKLYSKVEPKTVLAKNVRQVLTYVETGNVDAGLVYATDVWQSDKVKVVAAAPEASHSPVVYPVAVIKNSQESQAAKDFVQFLASDKAGKVFERYGFKRISSKASQ